MTLVEFAEQYYAQTGQELPWYQRQILEHLDKHPGAKLRVDWARSTQRRALSEMLRQYVETSNANTSRAPDKK